MQPVCQKMVDQRLGLPRRLLALSQNYRRLLDHLGSAGEDRWRHVEAERFGSLEVDSQLEDRRLLYRQIGWSFALQDPASVNSGLAKERCRVNSIADQAAGIDECASLMDRRY